MKKNMKLFKISRLSTALLLFVIAFNSCNDASYIQVQPAGLGTTNQGGSGTTQVTFYCTYASNLNARVQIYFDGVPKSSIYGGFYIVPTCGTASNTQCFTFSVSPNIIHNYSTEVYNWSPSMGNYLVSTSTASPTNLTLTSGECRLIQL